MPSVMGIFKRDSISSTPGSRRGSLQSLQQQRMDSPRHSIGSDGSGGGNGGSEGSDMNTMGVGRRGSTFLATPIPEVAEETERDLVEAEKTDERSLGHNSDVVLSSSPSHSGKFTLEKIDEGDVTNAQTKL